MSYAKLGKKAEATKIFSVLVNEADEQLSKMSFKEGDFFEKLIGHSRIFRSERFVQLFDPFFNYFSFITYHICSLNKK